MRPHDARSARRREADARRRLRIATTWLPGFPVDGQWQPFAPEPDDDPPAMRLGRDEIRRAERARVTLARDLPGFVEDGTFDALWWLIGRAKTDNLQGSAAERYRPRVRQALGKIDPALAEAISWWRLFSPSEVPADLEVAAHPAVTTVLARHGVLRAMRVLRAERTLGLGEILGWLGDPRSWRAPASAVVGDDLPKRQESVRTGVTAAEWWLGRVDVATGGPMRILAAIAPGPEVREAWLADRAGYVDRLVRIERRELAKAAEAPPKTPPFPVFTPADTEHSDDFARGLAALPDAPNLPRMDLAFMCQREDQMKGAAKALGAPLPWASIAQHIGDWRVHHHLMFGDAYAIAPLLREPCTPEDVDRASRAVQIAGPAAAALLAAVGPDGGLVWLANRFAVSVTSDPALLARLVAVVPADLGFESSKTLASAGPEALIRWFGDHRGKRLEALAALEPLARRPIPPPPDLEPTPWWGDLPEAFHDAVAALSRVDPDAEATTRRILGAALPDAASIRDELAWIDAQPPDHPRADSLAKRRAMLVRLGESRPTLGERRVENLVADLRRTASDKRLDRWEDHAREVTAPILRQRLGVEGNVGLLFDPRYARVVAGFDELDGAFRRIFARLLQARLGPPPWDLKDPANERIAARFVGMGLDTSAWVSRDLVHEGKLPDERVFRVALEPDPLEVLRMGEHFGTCLTPGQINWFSAVANAADWHRQVAYARDADGSVLGRTLLCLTDQGGLLSFNLYAHQHQDVLEPAMTAFARALAARMGTVVVARGRVPLAVAPRWYDDGPDDRAAAFPALDEGSAFREGLRTVRPEDLRAWVAGAFDPPPPAPLVLGWLAALPEAYGRRDLLAALLPDADDLADDDPGKVELYRRLYDAGERDRVVAWARGHAATVLRLRWADPQIDWLFDLAIEQFPGRVLAWARDLSPCAECGFHYDAFSAFQAARACVALHRPVEARRYAAAAVAPEAHRSLDKRFTEAARALTTP